MRVFDADARRVDDGAPTHPSSREVAVALDSGLARGTYTVAWHVVSADAHPVHGAFVFHVGAPGAKPAGIAAEVLHDDGGSTAVRVAFSVDRFLAFALILFCFGGTAALALVVRPDDEVEHVRRRLFGVVAIAALALAAVTVVGLPLQAAVAGGLPFDAAVRWASVSAVLHTRFGEVWAVRAGLALVLAALAFVLRRGVSQGELVLSMALLVGGGLVATPAAAGHAGVSGPFAFVTDVAHMQAAALWTGGLALVVAALVFAGSGRWPLAARAVPRFSTIAVWAVAVLVLSGVISGYLQVREWRGLWETTYGLLLLAKVALVLPILALGAYNNRFAVPKLRAETASPRQQRRFLRTAGVELVLMATVVGVTAMLVNQPPARAQLEPTGPQAVTAELGNLELNLVVDPATVGPNQIHLYLLGADGRPANVAAADVLASLPSRGIGPLRFPAHPAGPGHSIVHGANLPLPGTWQLTVEARRGEFEALSATVSIPIRKEP